MWEGTDLVELDGAGAHASHRGLRGVAEEVLGQALRQRPLEVAHVQRHALHLSMSQGEGGVSAGLGGWGRSSWECEASMERGPTPGVTWVGNRWCGHSQDEGEMAPRWLTGLCDTVGRKAAVRVCVSSAGRRCLTLGSLKASMLMVSLKIRPEAAISPTCQPTTAAAAAGYFHTSPCAGRNQGMRAPMAGRPPARQGTG